PAFSVEFWDLYYLAFLFFWMIAVIVEQLLPVTWKGRGAALILARALLAVLITLIVACGVEWKLLMLCH
ncbi:hypothetical protein AB0C31_40285, partial [Actinoplanes philippinensis]